MKEPYTHSFSTHRRASSKTKDSEVTDTPWPVATRMLLRDHERLSASHEPEQLNQAVFALIRARKAIGDARIAVAHARRLNAKNKATEKRLGVIGKRLEKEHAKFPLLVMV